MSAALTRNRSRSRHARLPAVITVAILVAAVVVAAYGMQLKWCAVNWIRVRFVTRRSISSAYATPPTPR